MKVRFEIDIDPQHLTDRYGLRTTDAEKIQRALECWLQAMADSTNECYDGTNEASLGDFWFPAESIRVEISES